jgi:FkbM family methyltransferase
MVKNSSKIKIIFFSIFKKIKKFFAKKGLTRFKLVRKIYDGIYLLLKPKEKIVLVSNEGNIFYIDTSDLGFGRFFLLSEKYEPFTTQIFKKELKEKMVFVDIGAHWGHYTLIGAKLVGKEGKVFAFEPHPDNYSLLCKNIKANNLSNVLPIQKAIADKSGKTKLFYDNFDSVTPTLYHSGKNQFLEVEAISLDDFFKDKEIRIDVVKMDIEGGEPNALEGMKEILKKNKKIKIFTEFNPKLLMMAGFSPKYFFKKFLELGFIVFNIDEDKKKLSPTTSEELLKKYKGESYTNLLAIRK